MMFRQDRWTSGISVVVLALASVCVAQAASAQTTGSIVQWGYAVWGLPPPNEDFTAVAAGQWHGLALRNNGSIATWGSNCDGQCDVPNPNRHFVAVAAANHSLGLRSDGSIVAWGLNDCGQCDVPGPNSDFVAISAGVYHSIGLKADGSIVVWGNSPTFRLRTQASSRLQRVGPPSAFAQDVPEPAKQAHYNPQTRRTMWAVYHSPSLSAKPHS